jgi:hypothetical protein
LALYIDATLPNGQTFSLYGHPATKGNYHIARDNSPVASYMSLADAMEDFASFVLASEPDEEKLFGTA